MGAKDKAKDDRLAAALRENLRRRKEQSRQLRGNRDTNPAEDRG
jgi:hypothetical protein